GVAERRMTEIVSKRKRLGQILVEPQPTSERTGDLRDFERVGQPGAVVVALIEHEDLGLVLEPAERGGMDDSVAIAAEGTAACARRLRIEAAAAQFGVARIWRTENGRLHRSAAVGNN